MLISIDSVGWKDGCQPFKFHRKIGPARVKLVHAIFKTSGNYYYSKVDRATIYINIGGLSKEVHTKDGSFTFVVPDNFKNSHRVDFFGEFEQIAKIIEPTDDFSVTISSNCIANEWNLVLEIDERPASPELLEL